MLLQCERGGVVPCAGSDAEKLSAFRAFWSSGKSLLGEAGGSGWLHATDIFSGGIDARSGEWRLDYHMTV